MIPVETIPRMRQGRITENNGGGSIQIWHVWYIVRTFINSTMYPHPAQQQQQKKSFRKGRV
jgi:hypothetical protein